VKLTRNTALQYGAALAVLVAMGVALAALPAQADHAATEKLYKTRCALCHAADGSGDTPAGKKTGARDFRDPEVKKVTDEQLIEVTLKGKGKMPPSKGLTEAQAKALVTYVRELAKK
jgi:mono/diheme cytochrome c family protein